MNLLLVLQILIFHDPFAFGVIVPLILSTCNFYLINVSLCCVHLACQFNLVFCGWEFWSYVINFKSLFCNVWTVTSQHSTSNFSCNFSEHKQKMVEGRKVRGTLGRLPALGFHSPAQRVRQTTLSVKKKNLNYEAGSVICVWGPAWNAYLFWWRLVKSEWFKLQVPASFQPQKGGQTN